MTTESKELVKFGNEILSPYSASASSAAVRTSSASSAGAITRTSSPRRSTSRLTQPVSGVRTVMRSRPSPSSSIDSHG